MTFHDTSRHSSEAKHGAVIVDVTVEAWMTVLAGSEEDAPAASYRLGINRAANHG